MSLTWWLTFAGLSAVLAARSVAPAGPQGKVLPLAPVGAVRTLPGPAAVYNAVAITRDGLKVAAGDAAPLDQGLAPVGGKDDGVVQVWDVGGGGPARAFRGRKRGTISRPNWLTGQLVAQFGRC